MNEPLSREASDLSAAMNSRGGITQMATTLDSLAPEARDPWDLLQRLASSLGGHDMQFDRSPLVLSIERALAHALADDKQHPGAVVLGQRFSSADGDRPPAFDTVAEEEKLAWTALAAKAVDALPRAHLRDLILSAGIDTSRELAEEIVDLYAELGERASLDPYYRGSALRRAWSVSRQFGMQHEPDVRKALYAMARSWDGIASVPVGVLLQPLEPLTVAPRVGDFIDPSRDEVKTLLQNALLRPERGATLLEGVTELLERIAISDAERDETRRALVDGYLALAANATGLGAVHWLEKAAAKAQQFGLIDLRDRAASSLQAIPVEELGLQRQAVNFFLPRYVYDSRLGRYRWSCDTCTALDIWLTGPSPTGSHEANLRQAKKLSSSGILQLLTRTTLSERGLPVRTTTGADEAEREQLERAESTNSGMHGIMLAGELVAIKTEHGPISAAAIAAHLEECYECDGELALALGGAFVSFWDGRHADAARAAYPLVEAGARGLLLTLGDPLYRVSTGNADGRFPALEAYAKRLQDHDFDIDWLRCLRNPVAGLRNALAHGHRHSVPDYEAAILIRVAALLVVLTPANSSEEDRLQIEARLRDPVGWTGSQARLTRRWRRTWVATRGIS